MATAPIICPHEMLYFPNYSRNVMHGKAHQCNSSIAKCYSNTNKCNVIHLDLANCYPRDHTANNQNYCKALQRYQENTHTIHSNILQTAVTVPKKHSYGAIYCEHL